LPDIRQGKNGHGINQVVDLAIEERESVRSPESFNSVSCSRVPVINYQLVTGADDADFKVIADMLKPYLAGADVGEESNNRSGSS
jgi:hypothetical protein